MKQHAATIGNLRTQSELGDQQRQQRELNFSNEIKDKLKEIVLERQEDINMITKMFEGNLKKVSQELVKVHDFVRQETQASDKKTKETFERLLEDKVRVDEVQEALKRITESFNFKLETLQENLTQALLTKFSEHFQTQNVSNEKLAKIKAEITNQNQVTESKIENLNS